MMIFHKSFFLAIVETGQVFMAEIYRILQNPTESYRTIHNHT